MSRVTTAPEARPDRQGRPGLVNPEWPITIKDGSNDVPDPVFMASLPRREEKASDVNIAAHLLQNVPGGAVDAAAAASSGSHVELPVTSAQERFGWTLAAPCGERG